MLDEESTTSLPRPVAVTTRPLTLPTYEPESASVYPAYLTSRVYQGSSGRVYPLPFHDRVAKEAQQRTWQAVELSNEWVEVTVLPELGGRVHSITDLSTGHEVTYNNDVIKPALVGLAGPWLAGGIEFNWPQHHRPATYLATDVEIEREPDGSVTVWCSDHDPFARMKGMHGIRLRPGSAAVEARVRLYNRTATTQTFLWWANVAARATPDYQSFFPEDVHVVADHARRAITAFPHADRPYYDIDYSQRTAVAGVAADGTEIAGDRLDWPRNIPVPTSYMVVESKEDFFGGFDHGTGVGFVHVADRQIAVGKKQWTWGNSPFGQRWCDNLADDGSSYIELMAGVFTDNQPDFAFLAPGETKVFTQTWYPLLRIGPVQAATADAALAVRLSGANPSVGVATTRSRAGLIVREVGAVVREHVIDVDPANPVTIPIDGGVQALSVHDGEHELVSWSPPVAVEKAEPEAAHEPPAPREVTTVEELVLIAEHLEQYRHATRDPEPYWFEALERDPGHVGAHLGIGARRTRQGLLGEAEEHLRAACDRLTSYHPTARDSTALYLLALVLERQGRASEAYDLYGRASWDRAWRAPAGYAMARIDARFERPAIARHRLLDVVRAEPEHLQARTLQGMVNGSEEELARILALDPLHWWTRHALGGELATDAPTCLDVALEYRGVGEYQAALGVLAVALERDASRQLGQTGCAPLIHLHRAWILAQQGREDGAAQAVAQADEADRRWCFPVRPEDHDVLAWAHEAYPASPAAAALLGHQLYDAGRSREAIGAWGRAAALDPGDAVVQRNLALARAVIEGDLDAAKEHYAQARRIAGSDAQLLFELDQLDRRRGAPVAERLARLDAEADLVARRDDLTVEYAHLLMSSGQAAGALDVLVNRDFQPWEGGEGEVLRAWDRANQLLGREALLAGDLATARARVHDALNPPTSLGEARHPLAATAGLYLLLGDVAAAQGDGDAARQAWSTAADAVGDFRTMEASEYGLATIDAVLARRRLGRDEDAADLAAQLGRFAAEQRAGVPRVPYFATSLPQLLLFPPDLVAERRILADVIEAQLGWADGEEALTKDRLARVLELVPDHPVANDLMGARA